MVSLHDAIDHTVDLVNAVLVLALLIALRRLQKRITALEAAQPLEEKWYHPDIDAEPTVKRDVSEEGIEWEPSSGS